MFIYSKLFIIAGCNVSGMSAEFLREIPCFICQYHFRNNLWIAENHKIYFIDNVNIVDCDLILNGWIIVGFISECISNQEVV